MDAESQRNCSIAMDAALAVTYCEDGYIAIDHPDVFK